MHEVYHNPCFNSPSHFPSSLLLALLCTPCTLLSFVKPLLAIHHCGAVGQAIAVHAVAAVYAVVAGDHVAAVFVAVFVC
ncbi:hypothetical protein EJ03DRAFT_329593 [Teratosphaeria nubilosa]|uniref:Uncharacterized protein n=1 Tax=Teratosphaeria nubilosa TaxID=161662 RepID=A0A6G1L378_9PEZI|nr:hypothetical protein EJ03DRAFT_329593 [Teratosphaeria nubilosa]